MFGTLPPYLLPILASAVLLGFYDIARKAAVKENPVLPVLLFATGCGTLLLCGVLLASGRFGTYYCCSGRDALLVLAKSALIASSWCCVYFAMRELPISIAAPIRASAPLWTFLGSLIFFAEYPDSLQGAGMLSVFLGYYLFSVAGKVDGLSWKKSRGLHYIVLGTLLGASSALYDKYLMNTLGIPRMTVQLHFQIDLIFIFAAALAVRRLTGRRSRYPFRWNWAIPLTGILLVCADFLYFYAVSVPDARISILSLLRRCSCIVTFGFGVVYFHERNIMAKAVALAVILLGVLLLAW